MHHFTWFVIPVIYSPVSFVQGSKATILLPLVGPLAPNSLPGWPQTKAFIAQLIRAIPYWQGST